MLSTEKTHFKRSPDPYTAGLDDDLACQAPPPPGPWDIARQRWDDLRAAHWSLLHDATSFCALNPELLPRELIGRLVWTSLAPDTRSLVSELLRPIVREELERLLVDELPAAVEVLVDRAMAKGNGHTTRRV
jgi:hypothetical protein